MDLSSYGLCHSCYKIGQPIRIVNEDVVDILNTVFGMQATDLSKWQICSKCHFQIVYIIDKFLKSIKNHSSTTTRDPNDMFCICCNRVDAIKLRSINQLIEVLRNIEKAIPLELPHSLEYEYFACYECWYIVKIVNKYKKMLKTNRQAKPVQSVFRHHHRKQQRKAPNFFALDSLPATKPFVINLGKRVECTKAVSKPQSPNIDSSDSSSEEILLSEYAKPSTSRENENQSHNLKLRILKRPGDIIRSSTLTVKDDEPQNPEQLDEDCQIKIRKKSNEFEEIQENNLNQPVNNLEVSKETVEGNDENLDSKTDIGTKDCVVVLPRLDIPSEPGSDATPLEDEALSEGTLSSSDNKNELIKDENQVESVTLNGQNENESPNSHLQLNDSAPTELLEAMATPEPRSSRYLMTTSSIHVVSQSTPITKSILTPDRYKNRSKKNDYRRKSVSFCDQVELFCYSPAQPVANEEEPDTFNTTPYDIDVIDLDIPDIAPSDEIKDQDLQSLDSIIEEVLSQDY